MLLLPCLDTKSRLKKWKTEVKALPKVNIFSVAINYFFPCFVAALHSYQWLVFCTGFVKTERTHLYYYPTD